MGFGNIDLTPQLVQAVRDAIDILSIASEHTRLKKAGKRHEGLCPLHKEKTPSFSVDPVQGLFYCFGCGAGGDAIKLHMLLSGDDFPAAIENLARRYGIPLPARGRRGGPRERDLGAALEAAQGFFVEQLRRSPAARSYLERRRIPSDLAERFGVGYAPESWTALLEELQSKVPLADLVAAGLVGRSERSDRPYDRFRHRLMFPILAPSGRIVGFGGRTLGDDKAKYVNTAETEEFHKSWLLYGLAQARRAIRETGRALLVEGYFDVLGAVAAGIEGTVASMGTSLTREQARLLARYAEEVVVGYDGDGAGEAAHRRALPLLLGEGLAVYRARFPDGHDPDSLRLAAGEEAVASAVADAADSVVLEIERIAEPEAAREPRRQAKAAKQLRELLAPIPDRVLSWGYHRVAAERLGVPPALLAGRSVAPAAAVGGEPPRASPGVRLVRSLEESVLELLLKGEKPLPESVALPPPEVFFDPACRNIYRSFCTLYERRAGPPPDVRAVMGDLGDEPVAVDRLAHIMVGGADVSHNRRLGELLEKLNHRWQQQRLKELAREINEAQRQGDPARLQKLSDEMTTLSRSRHRSARPGTVD